MAVSAHTSQKDKVGAPYPSPIARDAALPSDFREIAAVLHDVVEDGPGWTFDHHLGKGGFSDEIFPSC